MTKRRCYLAGPMRGRSASQAEHAFNWNARQLRCAGWEVLNPGAFGVQSVDGMTPKDFIVRDVAMLLSLNPAQGDAIVLLPGYELSPGARAELALAQWYGLRTLLLSEALQERHDEEVV